MGTLLEHFVGMYPEIILKRHWSLNVGRLIGCVLENAKPQMILNIGKS